MGKRVILFFVFAVVSYLGFSSNPCMAKDQKPYLDIVAKFFEILDEQKSGPAIDYVFGTNPWAEEQKAMVNQIKHQAAAMDPIVGALLDFDIYSDTELFDRYAYVVVLVAFERQPAKFEFHFYRAKDKWVLQNFNFHTDYFSLMQARSLFNSCEDGE